MGGGGVGEEIGKGKRKRNSTFLAEAVAEEPKRTRVHAQRKFAQGAGGASPHVSPLKEVRTRAKPDNGSSSSSSSSGPSFPLAKGSRPKTEDFLTFLCLRGTDQLPPELDFFNQAINNQAHESSDESFSDQDDVSKDPEVDKNGVAKKSTPKRLPKDAKPKKDSGSSTPNLKRKEPEVKPVKDAKKLQKLRPGSLDSASSPDSKAEPRTTRSQVDTADLNPQKDSLKRAVKVKKTDLNNSNSRESRALARQMQKVESSDESLSEHEEPGTGRKSQLQKSESEVDADEEASSRESSRRPGFSSSEDPKARVKDTLSRLKGREGRSTSRDSSGSKESVVVTRPARSTKEAAKVFLETLKPEEKGTDDPEKERVEAGSGSENGTVIDKSLKDKKERKKEKKHKNKAKNSLKDLQNILLEEAKRNIADPQPAMQNEGAKGPSTSPEDSEGNSDDRITISQKTGYISVKPRTSMDQVSEEGASESTSPQRRTSGAMSRVKSIERVPTPPRKILPKCAGEAASSLESPVSSHSNHLPAGVMGASSISNRLAQPLTSKAQAMVTTMAYSSQSSGSTYSQPLVIHTSMPSSQAPVQQGTVPALATGQPTIMMPSQAMHRMPLQVAAMPIVQGVGIRPGSQVITSGGYQTMPGIPILGPGGMQFGIPVQGGQVLQSGVRPQAHPAVVTVPTFIRSSFPYGGHMVEASQATSMPSQLPQTITMPSGTTIQYNVPPTSIRQASLPQAVSKSLTSPSSQPLGLSTHVIASSSSPLVSPGPPTLSPQIAGQRSSAAVTPTVTAKLGGGPPTLTPPVRKEEPRARKALDLKPQRAAQPPVSEQDRSPPPAPPPHLICDQRMAPLQQSQIVQVPLSQPVEAVQAPQPLYSPYPVYSGQPQGQHYPAQPSPGTYPPAYHSPGYGQPSPQGSYHSSHSPGLYMSPPALHISSPPHPYQSPYPQAYPMSPVQYNQYNQASQPPAPQTMHSPLTHSSAQYRSQQQDNNRASNQQQDRSEASSQQQDWSNTSSQQQDRNEATSQQQDRSKSFSQHLNRNKASSQQQDSIKVSSQQQDNSKASSQQQDRSKPSSQQQERSKASQQQDTSEASNKQQDRSVATSQHQDRREASNQQQDRIKAPINQLVRSEPSNQQQDRSKASIQQQDRSKAPILNQGRSKTLSQQEDNSKASREQEGRHQRGTNGKIEDRRVLAQPQDQRTPQPSTSHQTPTKAEEPPAPEMSSGKKKNAEKQITSKLGDSRNRLMKPIDVEDHSSPYAFDFENSEDLAVPFRKTSSPLKPPSMIKKSLAGPVKEHADLKPTGSSKKLSKQDSAKPTVVSPDKPLEIKCDMAKSVDDIKPPDNVDLDASSSDNETTYFIPLQNSTGQSFGVAVKLGTDGPSGPNQKVIMTAKLVTSPNAAPTKAKILGGKTTETPVPSNDGMLSPSQSTSTPTKDANTSRKIRMPNASPVAPNRMLEDGDGHLHSSPAKPRMRRAMSPDSGRSSGSQAKESGSISGQTGKKRPMCLLGQVSTGHRFPRLGQHAEMMEAPTFRPTEAEFKDPLRYIQKIRSYAEQFGMCRIVPPKSFKPECNVDDDMRFTAYNQYINRMLSRWGPNAKETAAIKKYLETQNVDTRAHPLVGGLEADLPALYHAVQSFGGLGEVIQKKKWPKIAEFLRVARGSNSTVAGNKLDDIYVKWLLPYDTLSAVEREELLRLVEEEWSEQSRERARKTQNKENGDDGDEEEEEEEEEDEDQEAVVKGKATSLTAFYRLATNLMKTVFRNDEPPHFTVEDEYWKIVSDKDVHMQVSQGSIDTGMEGFGFPIRNSPFAAHPWNLKVLTKNSRSILRAMGSVMGVTQPTLHVGMLFTTGCWYRDPHGLPWIEYLHTGSPKIWYGIPDDHSLAFYTAMKQLVPSFCKNQKIWMPSDTTMVSPSLLVKHGVSVCRAVQQPGQFVVVFPKSYTSSICTGYCVSESVYYAPADWLRDADHVFQDIRDSMEPMMFPLEKMLFALASDANSTKYVLEALKPKVG